MTEDLSVLDSRTEEEAREQRWAAFTAGLKRQQRNEGWWGLVLECGWNMQGNADGDNDNEVALPMRAFAETEGWDGVLSAIARAMREQAKP